MYTTLHKVVPNSILIMPDWPALHIFSWKKLPAENDKKLYKMTTHSDTLSTWSVTINYKSSRIKQPHSYQFIINAELANSTSYIRYVEAHSCNWVDISLSITRQWTVDVTLWCWSISNYFWSSSCWRHVCWMRHLKNHQQTVKFSQCL